MPVTHIIAVRHGQTAWNVEQRIQGHLDIGLDAIGHLQAAQLAQALSNETVDAIYASNLLRAWQTAQAIGQRLQCPLHPVAGLRERSFGTLEGQSYAEIEANWPAISQQWSKRDPLWAPVGGESLAQVQQRVQQTATELAAKHPDQQIVLVAHGGVLDILYRLATQQTLQAPRSWALGNAAINRLCYDGCGFSLVSWNDVKHLQASTADEGSADLARR